MTDSLDKHKKAAVKNLKLLEDQIAALEDDESPEALARAITLGLSTLVHALLYIGDAS